MPWGALDLDWGKITRWHDEMAAAAREGGVDIARLAAHVVIESQGEPRAVQKNPSNGNSYGLCQIVPFGVGWEGWHALVTRLTGETSDDRIIAALYDPALNLRVGAAILSQLKVTHGTWDRASSAFFLGNPDWRGADTVNDTTGAAYRAALGGLMAEWLGVSAPAPEPAPVDLIAAIVGGAPFADDYGFKTPTELPYYTYFAGHGGQPNQHTGIDVTGQIGEPLYAPIAGTVVCAGEGVGPGAHGSGCAAFPFTLGAKTGSSGRFELVTDDGRFSLILGHVQRCLVPVGARVAAGQQVALMGGMNGPHVHVEARRWEGGDYTIIDPRQAFGRVPMPGRYAPRVPYGWDDDPNTFRVKVTRDGVPVRQRADPAAPEVAPPLKAGEEFAALALVPGNDGKQWWLSASLGRVPTEGTEAA